MREKSPLPSPVPGDPLAALVHAEDAPRYVLLRAALSSYLLGSIGEHHHAAKGLARPLAQYGDPDAPAANGGGGGGGAGADGGSGGGGAAEQLARLGALEAEGASLRSSVSNIMRVVLALDERLRGVEEARGAAARPNGHAEEGAARKRAR